MAYTLLIERRYPNSPGSGGFWPAFECETREDADELLTEYPPVYGEVSRQGVGGGRLPRRHRIHQPGAEG